MKQSNISSRTALGNTEIIRARIALFMSAQLIFGHWRCALPPHICSVSVGGVSAAERRAPRPTGSQTCSTTPLATTWNYYTISCKCLASRCAPVYTKGLVSHTCSSCQTVGWTLATRVGVCMCVQIWQLCNMSYCNILIRKHYRHCSTHATTSKTKWQI